MNVYITKINGMSHRSTEQYAQRMVADIAHSLGFREMGIFCYPTEGELFESRVRRFDGIIAGMQEGDVVVCQFPTGNGLTFEREIIRHIKAYGGRIIIFIEDVEALMSEADREKLQDAVSLYNEAEVLIVPSFQMKRFLVEHGAHPGMKYIVQEMWDDTVRSHIPAGRGLFREIHYAGEPDGVGFPNVWDYDVPLILYSDQECEGAAVRRMGWTEPEHLSMELSKGGFGLVWYGNEDRRQYLTMNNSFKLGTYLAAGIPVIAPRGISNESIIEENHLGILVDTLDEAVNIVKIMTEQEYQGYVSAVERFAPLLRQGFFTKKCLLDAVQMSMRKDLHTYSETKEIYAVPDGAFTYICLKESYEDNLALSWTFRGEADGFLIYDADSGKLAGEAFYGLEHYLLLKGYPKEARFVVKAYIRTLKGKMILAQSDIAAVCEHHFEKAAVSLIMPAYNMEECIVRSIDTALAQSFQDMELIIVNDGSTDGTQKIIDWYLERYPQVRTIYRENGGLSAARNTGILHAAGEYIGFMDSDDMIRPDMMERLYDSIQKNGCDIAMTSAYLLTKHGYGRGLEYPFLEEDTAVAADDFLEYHFGHGDPQVWNKLYRSQLVKGRPFALVTYEDSAWTPYILSYAETICYLNEHLYEYDRSLGRFTLSDAIEASQMDKRYKDRRDFILFFLKNGNPEKKDMLKCLALEFAVYFIRESPDPRYRELREEIERMQV